MSRLVQWKDFTKPYGWYGTSRMAVLIVVTPSKLGLEDANPSRAEFQLYNRLCTPEETTLQVVGMGQACLLCKSLSLVGIVSS
jgi:hypothetical protein